MASDIEKAAKEVVAAYTIRGAYPKYHVQQERKLETSWPTLYNAIQDLVEAVRSAK